MPLESEIVETAQDLVTRARSLEALVKKAKPLPAKVAAGALVELDKLTSRLAKIAGKVEAQVNGE
jgi:hypothetical protein